MGPKQHKRVIIPPSPEPIAPSPPHEGDTPPPAAEAAPIPIVEPQQQQPPATSLAIPPPTIHENQINDTDIENEQEEEEQDIRQQPQQPTTSRQQQIRKNEPDQIETLVKMFYESNPFAIRNEIYNELEVRFGTRGVQHINKTDYDSVIQIIKSFGFTCANELGEYSLKIQNEIIDKTGTAKISDNLRVEIYGMNAIQIYCRTNDLKTLVKTDPLSVKYTNKHSVFINNKRVPNVIKEDFNFIVSYKIEEPMNHNIKGTLLDNWGNYRKSFRYLNRVTFTHPDLPILVDMSIVKSSPKNPKGGYQMFHTTGEAGIFGNNDNATAGTGTKTAVPQLTYEIELEIDPSRIGPGTAFNSYAKLAAMLKQTIKTVLSGLQHTNYPVSYNEQYDIQHQYLHLIGRTWEPHRRINGSVFIGPSSFTLQLPHIAPFDPNSKEPNIRRNFVVTEKADGERNLLYIATDSGKIYFITTAMSVIFTGAKTNKKELWGTILDGELILRDKMGTWINLFAAFDIYYLKGTDVRALPFIKIAAPNNGIDSGISDHTPRPVTPKDDQRYRHELLKEVVGGIDMVNIVESMNKINISPIRLDYKRFYAHGDSATGTDFDIFAACKNILQREKDGIYPYNIDGLIFTHTTFGVGASEPGKAGELKKQTWAYSFKWKPPKYNTIDFLISVVKGNNSEDLVKTRFESGENSDVNRELLQYKTVKLRSTYFENQGIYVNACQMVYDDDVRGKTQQQQNMDEISPDRNIVKQFYPTNPYDIAAGEAFIELRLDNAGEMQMYTQEGQVIPDNSVVEFAYDFDKEDRWRWIPLRMRYDKSENAYHVANDIWKNIHYPITDDMIASGLNIPDATMVDSDVYYNNKGKQPRAEFITRNLKTFHNYLKSALISGVAQTATKPSLIDFACGKGGDLKKWTASKIGFVFGIDLSRDNLENPLDGACARYLNECKRAKEVPDCLFVQGNSSFNIRNGDAMITEKSTQISRAVFGQGEKNEAKLGRGVNRLYGKGAAGFNIASMQFALHYMFAGEKELQSFVRNLSECIMIGGYFIATFYDGKTVFNLLRNKKKGEMVSLFENVNGSTLGGAAGQGMGPDTGDIRIWGITKEYDNPTTSASDMGGSGGAKLPNNIQSVGLKINVFQESIGQWISEYLVNFDFFTRVMEEYGFVLPVASEIHELGLPAATGMFDVIYNQVVSAATTSAAATTTNRRNFADARTIESVMAMSESEREISFLNRYCVFKKVRAVEPQKIHIDRLGDFNEYRAAVNNVTAIISEEKAAAPTAPKPKPIRRLKKAPVAIAETPSPVAHAAAPADIIPVQVPDAPLEINQLVDKEAVVENILAPVAVAPKRRAPVRRKKVVIEE